MQKKTLIQQNLVRANIFCQSHCPSLYQSSTVVWHYYSIYSLKLVVIINQTGFTGTIMCSSRKYLYLPYRRDFLLDPTPHPPPLWKFQLSFILQGCQNKPATGAFHRLFWILRRLLRMLVGQFWAWYWRNKMEIAAYFLDGTCYSKTYWQPWYFIHFLSLQNPPPPGNSNPFCGGVWIFSGPA